MRPKVGIWAIYKKDNQLVVNYIHRTHDESKDPTDILNEYFRDFSRVEELFSYGNIAKLSGRINPRENVPHEYENWDEETCVFFCRDYGDPEDLCELEYFDSEEDFLNSEKLGRIIVFFNGEEWIEVSLSEAVERGYILEEVK